MDLILLSFMLLIGLWVFVLFQLVVMPIFSDQAVELRRIRNRLLRISASGNLDTALVSAEKLRYKPSRLERQLNGLLGMSELERAIRQAGWKMPPYLIVLTCMGLGLAAGLGVWTLSFRPGPTLLAFAIGFFLPLGKLKLDRSRRLDKFEGQLPDAIELMVGYLKVGHPFILAMSRIGREMTDPIAAEFRTTAEEINYGRELLPALDALSLRVPRLSLMAMTTAIAVHRETGGNIAEILLKIGKLLRDRYKFERHVHTLTAEGRMAGVIMMLLPPGLFGSIYLLHPGYYDAMLRNPVGPYMLALASGLIMVGAVWIRYMVKIEV